MLKKITMRPLLLVLTFVKVLLSLSLKIVAAAEASNEPPPQHPVRVQASASAPAPFQQLCHVLTSYLALAWAVIRRKYQKILHGQLGFVDMVQLIALCSFVQGIRLWRNTSSTRKEQGSIEDASHDERKVGGSMKLSSRISVRSSKPSESRWRMHWQQNNAHAETKFRAVRRGNYRSWSVEKAFHFSVFHNLRCNLSFNPDLLQTTSTSRQASIAPNAPSPPGLHTRARRVFGTIQSSFDKPGQCGTLSWSRSARMWTLCILSHFMGGLHTEGSCRATESGNQTIL